MRSLPLPSRATRNVPCERLDALGTRAPAERDGDLGPLARLVRRGCGLRIAEIADHGLLRAEPDERLEHAGRVRRRAAPRIVLRVAEHHRPRGACAQSPSPRARLARARPSARRTPASLQRDLASERIGGPVRRRLAPGVGDHGRAAPVEVGGRKAREIGEIDELALGDHRARDDALRRLDQRALVVERDQERQLAQGASGRATSLQEERQGAGRMLRRSPADRRAGRCDRRRGCRSCSTISGVTLAW